MNDERKAEMMNLVGQGLTLKQIGDQYGVSRQRVSQIVGKVGSRARRIIAENIDAIMEQWEQSEPMSHIAKRFGLSPGALSGNLNIPKNWYGTLVHGTRNGYQYHKCSCDECRGANYASRKEYYHSRRRQKRCVTCGAPSPDTWRCATCRQRYRRGV